MGQALEDLLDHVRTAGQAAVTTHDLALDTILTSSDKLMASHGNAAEMVRQAKILATATSTLIQTIKMEVSNVQTIEMEVNNVQTIKMEVCNVQL